MFHKEYLRLKKFKEKLSKKFDNDQKIINQPITIRDIFIYPLLSEGFYGESKDSRNLFKEHPSIARLVDQVELLASIANTYHQKYYCNRYNDGTYSIKEAFRNNITRVLLSEFSLYSAEPMSLTDYSLLLDAITEISKNQMPNVHLLLSSMAVVLESKQILNMSVYVQCGQEPILVSFCKGTPSVIDVAYKDTINYGQQEINGTPMNVIEYASSDKGLVISSDTVSAPARGHNTQKTRVLVRATI